MKKKSEIKTKSSPPSPFGGGWLRKPSRVLLRRSGGRLELVTPRRPKSPDLDRDCLSPRLPTTPHRLLGDGFAGRTGERRTVDLIHIARAEGRGGKAR
jgi:hypothetical protein